MSNEAFHYFPELPPEIRYMIWELCLPYRVAQVDPCDTSIGPRNVAIIGIDLKYNECKDQMTELLYWMDELPVKRGSVVAELIHPFRLHALLDGANDSEVSRSPIAKYGRKTDITISDMSHYTFFYPGHQTCLDVVMAAVSLHITKESAVRSGLFGLLGDAPIQLIDVADEVQLRKYEAIYRGHLTDKEPKVQKVFDVLMSPRFTRP
ncbi:hypothetical protein DPV78_002527 [Talaromyces pinophilus]|nr:hypothetical protein DPV78_002527 [Talaromyces pinophilus]